MSVLSVFNKYFNYQTTWTQVQLRSTSTERVAALMTTDEMSRVRERIIKEQCDAFIPDLNQMLVGGKIVQPSPEIKNELRRRLLKVGWTKETLGHLWTLFVVN
jgi:hypothetical protein